MNDHPEDEEEGVMDKNLEDLRIGFMRFGYSICIGIRSSAEGSRELERVTDPSLIDQCHPILTQVTSNLRAAEIDFFRKTRSSRS